MYKKIITLFLISLMFCGNCWAANKTVYVNTDATGGTYDGTTLATGYLTMAAMEDAEDGVAYGVGETCTVYCSGTTADTTAVVFAGWDADVAIIINGNYSVTQTDSLAWNTSYYRLDVTDADALITDFTNTFTLNNVQVKSNYDVETENLRAISTDSASGTNIRTIKNCIIIGNKTSGITFTGGNAATNLIYNCLIYKQGANTSGFGIEWIVSNFDINLNIFNCTIYGFKTGYHKDNGNVPSCINCIGNGCTDNFNAVTTAYCASDIVDDLSGTGDRDGTDGDVTFVDSTIDGGENFHLSSADTNALDNGNGATPKSFFTVDIDGTTRSTTDLDWDIGADEYVASATALSQVIKVGDE